MNDILSGFSNSNEQMLRLVIYIAAIIFILSIVRSAFRLMLPVVVIGLVMVVFLGFTPSDVIQKGKQLANAGTDFFLESIVPYLHPNNGSLIDGDGKEKNDSEIPPEGKSFTEDNSKKFFQKDEENKDTELFGEPKDDSKVNRL